MKPHQERVVTEYEELLSKTLALGKFLDTPVFEQLDEAEQARLREQWKVMQQYGLILSQRIAAFN
jgi:hypothetical protein